MVQSASSPPVLPFQPKSLPEVHFVLIWLQTSVSPPSVGDAFAPSLPVCGRQLAMPRLEPVGTDGREGGCVDWSIDWWTEGRGWTEAQGHWVLMSGLDPGWCDAHSCPPHTHLQCGQLPTSQFYLLKPAVWLLNCFYTHNFVLIQVSVQKESFCRGNNHFPSVSSEQCVRHEKRV